MLTSADLNQFAANTVGDLARGLLERASEARLTLRGRRRTRQRYRTLVRELKQFRHGELIELGLAPADIDRFARDAIYGEEKAYNPAAEKPACQPI
jgi:hypothetical protein